MVVLKGSFPDQRRAIRDAFIDLRGFRIGRDHQPYPKTTNADVKAIIGNWSDAVRRFGRSSDDKSARDRWTAISKAYLQDIATKPPNEEFGENKRFWQSELFRVSIWLNSFGAIPSEGQMFKESVIESIDELPSTLGSVAGAVGDVLSDVASGAGSVLAAPIKSFARGLGITPVNATIALAAVGGVGYAVMRSRKISRKKGTTT